MLRPVLHNISCSIYVCVLCCLPFLGHAQLDNKENPLVTAKHAGSAHEIAVVWLADASNTDGWQDDALINVIKWWINWVLGILGLIALIILLYGGLLMVISAGEEEKYKKWRTILKHAAIGLAIIGVARFIVSIIFWLVNQATDGVGGADTET